MKIFNKKTLAALMSSMLIFTTGCGGDAAESTADGAAVADGEKIDIGVIQLMDHPALNEILDSFTVEMAALGYDESKINIHYQNGNGDFSNLNSIAQKFVGENVDVILAIATPSAQAAAAQTTTIPIVFSAVTDPYDAGLVENYDAPEGNITGVSDAIDVEAIFELAKELTPDVQKFGFLYNSGESNSVSSINQAKAYCDANGIEYIEATVTNSSEVQQATLQLLSNCDAIFSPTDNTIASAMPNVASLAMEQNKAVYVGADTMVADGGLATIGVSYTNLGKVTADVTAQIIAGTSVDQIPVTTMTEYATVINATTAAALNVEINNDSYVIVD